MIDTIKVLKFFIKADAIMNEQSFRHGLRSWLFPSLIQKFLVNLRITEYLNYKYHHNKLWLPLYVLFLIRHNIIENKTGFYIPLNSVGYGVRISHLCGIIINGNTRIGNYCCLFRCSFADAQPKIIGSHVFIGTNVVITGNIKIADGCSIAAMSLVNKSIEAEDQLWGGVPARFLKKSEPWTNHPLYLDEVNRCETIKKRLGLYSL